MLFELALEQDLGDEAVPPALAGAALRVGVTGADVPTVTTTSVRPPVDTLDAIRKGV